MPKPLSQQPQTGAVLHEWAVREYEEHPRSPYWYIVMIILGILLVAYGFFTGNFLFALIIILAGIIVFLQSYEEPIQIPFRITELGIIISNRFYSYSEFEHFAIVYHPPEVKTLYLDTKSFSKPLIRIPLQDQNPVAIRHTLQEFLLEDLEREEEPLSDRIARNWGIH